MNQEQAIIRGNDASSLINSPLFKEAMLLIRAEITEKFAKTKFHQKDERDELWRKMQTIDAIEKYLKKVIVTGNLGKPTRKERKRLRDLKIA